MVCCRQRPTPVNSNIEPTRRDTITLGTVCQRSFTGKLPTDKTPQFRIWIELVLVKVARLDDQPSL